MLFQKTKTIIIVGVSRFGISLAERLSGRNTRIIVIDLSVEAFQKLPREFAGEQVLGDGTDAELLKKAGICQAQVFVAAMGNDNENLLAAQIASRIFHVPEVILRLNDESKEKLIQGYNMKPICPFALSADEFDRLTEKVYEEVSAS
ncbi:MAG: TrkA family potassium uptake protein [Lacrimispora sp.]|jgi:trk system potassium uptake protein TrkA|nr:TrkA family potassium uptake protein [Lacrimispora sp.]